MSFRRLTHLLLVVTLLLGGLAQAPAPAQAAPLSELEPNNSFAQAQLLPAIGLGSPLSAAIDTGGDRDWYGFAATMGETYVIELFEVDSNLHNYGAYCTGNGYDTPRGLALHIFDQNLVEYYGSRCDAISTGKGNVHAVIEFPAPASTNYYIQIKPNSPSATGSYKLRVLPKYDQPGAEWDSLTFEPNNSRFTSYLIGVGRTSAISSRIEGRAPVFSTSHSDRDWYHFEAVKDRTYVIELFDVSSSLHSYGAECTGNSYENPRGLALHVSDKDATNLGDGTCEGASRRGLGNTHNIVTFKAPDTDTYFIRVMPNHPSASGSYKLRVLPQFDQTGADWDTDTFEPNNDIANSYPIAFGDESALRGTIEPRAPSFSTFHADRDWYRFNATEGMTYTVVLFNVDRGLVGAGSDCDGTSRTGMGLRIHDPDAIIVAGGCNGTNISGPDTIHRSLQFTADKSGPHHIMLRPNAGGATGDYSLRVCQGLCSDPQPANWLVLLYLAGDDRDTGRGDVESLNEPMTRLLVRLNTMPYNPQARLVILYDGQDDGDSTIYVREPAGLQDVTEAVAASSIWIGGMDGSPGARELDTGSPTTLRNFITWARAAHPQPAYTFLSLVDHGGGWAPDLDTQDQPRGVGFVQSGGWRGISLDMTSGGSSLATRETSAALEGMHIDLLFFDACLMGMIESVYQVRDLADYVVAGQNLLFATLPYERYLRDLTNETSPETLARRIVELYNRGERDPVTLSALDLRQLRTDAPGDLAARIDVLAQLLLNALPDPAPADHPIVLAIKAAYNQSQKFDYDSSGTINEREGYVDLVDFAQRLSADAGLSADIRTAADEVVAAATAGEAPVILAQRGRSGFHRGNYWSFARANGLSIYLPLGERDHRPTRYDPANPAQALPERQLDYYTDCAQLAFACDAPQWGALLARLEPTVTLIRTGLDGTAPFTTPAQLNPSSIVYLPLTQR